MNLNLDKYLIQNYKSAAQIARVLTENWVKENAYCPNCGESLSKFENNRPVADFLCNKCLEEFELKSKNSHTIGRKIVDGAYSTMIERILSENNPNFFFLTYKKLEVINFLIIPNFFFIPDIIEKRKPLTQSARRTGWVGCNINLQSIPESGRIFIIKQKKIINKNIVRANWEKTLFLKNKKGENKGWIIDIMNCVDKIKSEYFKLEDIYLFEEYLKEKHPKNNFIKDKIRQQLQILRDKGLIEFLGNGKYKKVRQ